MPFGNISSQSLTYNDRGDGRYVLSTLGFGDPENLFVVRPAIPKQDPMRCSVSRTLQKDVTVSGSTVRKNATVTVSIVTPPANYSATELDSLVTDLANFLTAETITRMFQGES